MPIEHSKALESLEAFQASFENKLLTFPGLTDPVYARPLSCEEMDKLNKYSGNEYNVRLVVMACVNEDGSKTFMETDIPRLRRIGPGVIAPVANQISLHLFSNFDALPEDPAGKKKASPADTSTD
jgi:hypothetical protein